MGVFAVAFAVLFPTVSHAAGIIQGYKVLVGNGGDISLIRQSKVYLDGELVTTADPFRFEGLSAREYKVSVNVPAGYIVGYTVCRNRVDCHYQAPKSGNAVEVSVPKDGFADVWWHFKKDLPVLSGYTKTASVVDRIGAWDYAPSSIVLPDNPNQARLFWCSTDQNLRGKTADSIFSIGYDIAARKVLGEPVKVLAPSADGWDSYHTCDPSVVAGKFSLNGASYAYAMYYTATDRPGIENHIGVAFSNDLLTWTKYENFVIRPESLSGKTYGAGQTSVVNRGGTIFLFHVDRSRGVQKILFRTTQDGIRFSDAQPISVQGLEIPTIDAPVFAYDSELKKWFLTTGVFDESRSCGASPARFPVASVHTFITDDFKTGTWTKVASVDSGNHNLIMDHNPGFLTDAYGDIARFHSSLPTFYGHGFCFDINSWSMQMSEGTFVWPDPKEEEARIESERKAALEKSIMAQASAAETSDTADADAKAQPLPCPEQRGLKPPSHPFDIAGILNLAFDAVAQLFLCL